MGEFRHNGFRNNDSLEKLWQDPDGPTQYEIVQWAGVGNDGGTHAVPRIRASVALSVSKSESE
jgi:hypothetical protein